jgi:hypothetical protein
MQDENIGIYLKSVAVVRIWDLFDCTSEYDNEFLFPLNDDFSSSCDAILN